MKLIKYMFFYPLNYIKQKLLFKRIWIKNFIYS